VEISGVQVGRTPVTFPFTWYGDYEIILSLDGYETLVTHADITPPWYEVPPLDLFSEIAPWTYHDQRFLHYELTPGEPTPREQLIRRADELAEENRKSVEH
jgi:hypothetical protein